jgi:hypothetical protein
MREMEEVHRQREAEKAASLQQRLSRSVASLPPPHQFMREMEEVHRQREAEKAASLQQRLSRLVR